MKCGLVTAVVLMACLTGRAWAFDAPAVAASVPRIVLLQKDGSWESGSGFVVHSESNACVVATNFHVIAGCKPDTSLYVLRKIDGGIEARKAEIIAKSNERDLALLRVPGFNAKAPVLLDFGSARQAISNRSLAMTSIVTSGYAPFEQYYEDGNQGPWSDIYALGAVMYRAITGKKPPEATRRLKDDPCERLAARYLGVYGAEFLKAIDSALLMNESMRPQSVAEWCGMLGVKARDAAPLLPIRTPLTWVGMIHRWAGMIRRLQEQPWLGAAAIVTALVCVAGAWELFKSKPVVQPDKPAAISSPPGATAVIAQGNTAVTAPATGNPSPPQPASVPGSPTPAPAAPSPTPMPESQPADSAAPAPPPKGQESATVDSRLVGSWETGSTKSKRERWDLWANGHWIVSGPANDAGTFTTADGHIDQFSNITQQSADLTYEFDGDILVTHSPSGTKNWRRMDDSSAKEGGEEPSSVTKTQSRRESGSHESHSTRLPEVGRKIGRILRSRF